NDEDAAKFEATAGTVQLAGPINLSAIVTSIGGIRLATAAASAVRQIPSTSSATSATFMPTRPVERRLLPHFLAGRRSTKTVSGDLKSTIQQAPPRTNLF